MADFNLDNVATSAALPASASISPQQTSISQHSLRDQIELAKLKTAASAFDDPPENCIPGVRTYVVEPPGAF